VLETRESRLSRTKPANHGILQRMEKEEGQHREDAVLKVNLFGVVSCKSSGRLGKGSQIVLSSAKENRMQMLGGDDDAGPNKLTRRRVGWGASSLGSKGKKKGKNQKAPSECDAIDRHQRGKKKNGLGRGEK